MKIERKPVNRMSLQKFADRHKLTMELNERTRTDLHPSFDYHLMRFYASFKNVEVQDGSVLCGTHGNGSTEGLAMQDYAAKISGKCLVVHAFEKKKRREIYAPELFVAL